MTKLPHLGVFVRLKPSSLHGIGVFAIHDIPKGTYIFSGDNGEMVWVKASTTGRLSKEVKGLYRDFCVLRDGKYGCPRSFNVMTPAWYINHSDEPNIAADQNFDFYATRRIKMGEELTLSYKKQSDAERRKAF